MPHYCDISVHVSEKTHTVMSTAGFGTVDTSNWWCMHGGVTNNNPSHSPCLLGLLLHYHLGQKTEVSRGNRDCVMGMLLVSHFREEEDLLFNVFVEYFATES